MLFALRVNWKETFTAKIVINNIRLYLNYWTFCFKISDLLCFVNRAAHCAQMIVYQIV
jgi:hypothetical protein